MLTAVTVENMFQKNYRSVFDKRLKTKTSVICIRYP